MSDLNLSVPNAKPFFKQLKKITQKAHLLDLTVGLRTHKWAPNALVLPSGKHCSELKWPEIGLSSQNPDSCYRQLLLHLYTSLLLISLLCIAQSPFETFLRRQQRLKCQCSTQMEPVLHLLYGKQEGHHSYISQCLVECSTCIKNNWLSWTQERVR